MTRSNLVRGAMLALVSIVAVAGDLQSARAPSDGVTSSTKPGWHRHGPGMRAASPEGGLLKVLGQLNLNDTQQQQIHTILESAHQQMKTDWQGEIADLPAFGNPGDPQYAAAVQAAQSRAAQRIRRWSETQQQVYAVLTQPQQAQLPQLLTALQQRLLARHDHGDQADQGAGANP